MKPFAIMGSNADHSYNHDLLKFVKKYFTGRYDIELGEVRDLPIFRGGIEEPAEVANSAKKITEADAVLISTLGQRHSVSSSLKSALEWLSSAEHSFKNKPMVIAETSVLPQVSARGQGHLKMVLSSPGSSTKAFSEDEFMMGTAPEQFGENGDLLDGTVKFSDHSSDELDVFYSEAGNCK